MPCHTHGPYRDYRRRDEHPLRTAFPAACTNVPLRPHQPQRSHGVHPALGAHRLRPQKEKHDPEDPLQAMERRPPGLLPPVLAEKPSSAGARMLPTAEKPGSLPPSE